MVRGLNLRQQHFSDSFLDELSTGIHVGNVTIGPDGKVDIANSLLLELLFSHYDPQNIGIIDYHGATRNYGREQVGGINLNIDSSTEDKLRQHALYNWANKYANLKTEMASSYVQYLLAKEADPTAAPDNSLSDTLKELFATFFPGKDFVGPRPTKEGRLEFPVRTYTGAEHDINELSSGEKEVLYGYLRLRKTAPKNSVLLIDEPELHLNPRLISGLASFYHRHLGRALGNQIWLVTHSDTLIREAVGQNGFNVFHMQPPGQFEGPNQATQVQAERDLERLVIELVGDLAAYRPGAKIVVFEGGGDSEFDVRMTCTLFPKFQAAVNAISGGNKRRVTDLYGLLENARAAGHLPAKFFAITDSDGEPPTQPEVPTRFKWDVYHIENYLLEPDFILRVLKEVNEARGPVDTVEGIDRELRRCAEHTVPGLVAHNLRNITNRSLIESLDLGFDPTRTDIAVALAESVKRCNERIARLLRDKLSPESLHVAEVALANESQLHLESGAWRTSFRGRDVLRQFVHRHVKGILYEPFRDLIIARMREADFQPPGMKRIIDRVLEAASK